MQQRVFAAYRIILYLLPLLFLQSCKTEDSGGGTTTPSVVVAMATYRDMSDTRQVSAPVVAWERVYITSRIHGILSEVKFEEGDRVSRGEMMARVDTRSQESQLRMARARESEALQHYNRQKKLFDQQVITPVEYENAALQLEQARSEVEFWEVEVDFGTITAPVDGVVTARMLHAGTTVSSGDRLFTLENHNLLVVRPALSELDVARLEKGQKLMLGFDVFGKQKYPGVIRRIFPAADAASRLFTVEVEILQDQIPHVVRPGYLVRTHFVLSDLSQALAIPDEAMQIHNGEHRAYLIQNNRIQIKTVKTGIQRDGFTSVMDGLSEGDTVVAGRVRGLEEGAKVSISGMFKRQGFR